MNTLLPLNPFAISGLLITLTFSPLLLFILFNGKTHLSFIYALHLVSVLIWGIGAFLVAITKYPAMAYKMWIFADSGVIFIPVFFYHAVALMIKQKSRLIIFLIYCQAFIFFYALLNGMMIIDMKYLFDSFYYKVITPVFAVFFVGWAIIVSLAHIKLLNHYQKCYPKEKQQIKALLFAMTGFIGGINNFLPAFGIELYPIGNFIVPIIPLTGAYAILKHQLLGIHIVIKKGVVYSILILIISLSYLLLVVLLEKSLQGLWGYQSMAISLITAFIIGIAFFPLHNRIQKLVDRFVFRKSPQEVIEENEFLRQEVEKTDKLKTVATLASSIAHEIRNPLTSLKTFVEYFPHKKHDPQFQEKFHAIVTIEVNRIEEILSQLLEFSKPSPLNLKETRVAHVIENALTSNSLSRQNISVVKDFAPSLPTLKADPNKLLQVFLNLILNAQDAMPKGGTLTITTKSIGPGRDTNYEIRDTNSIKILLSDTGTGISREHLKKIFDPFFSTKEKGTGLGLSICQSIIEDHGGKITAESQGNAGTTFKIVLPAIN